MDKLFLLPHDSRLKERSLEVDDIHSQETQALIDQMFSLAAGKRGDPAHRGMVGLAAPQIGVLKRVILVDIGVDTTRRAWGQLQVFINPKIIKSSPEISLDREACFSVDDHVCGIVPRAKWIKIEAYNREGFAFCAEYHDYTARIFQHEMDHLDGIRFPDRVGPKGKLHWVEANQYPDYRQKWHRWPASFPWEGWQAMQEGKVYYPTISPE